MLAGWARACSSTAPRRPATVGLPATTAAPAAQVSSRPAATTARARPVSVSYQYCHKSSFQEKEALFRTRMLLPHVVGNGALTCCDCHRQLASASTVVQALPPGPGRQCNSNGYYSDLGHNIIEHSPLSRSPVLLMNVRVTAKNHVTGTL